LKRNFLKCASRAVNVNKSDPIRFIRFIQNQNHPSLWMKSFNVKAVFKNLLWIRLKLIVQVVINSFIVKLPGPAMDKIVEKKQGPEDFIDYHGVQIVFLKFPKIKKKLTVLNLVSVMNVILNRIPY
jgi:hypothetical protein